MTNKEKLLKAKIPCPETGIEIRHTLCDICAPGNHCGVSAYVLDGRIIKVEGDENHPHNRGLLCTKGASNRQYIYSENRILTPLRRIGARGEGRFAPISWDEAYAEIAEKLNAIKEESGPEAVSFFSGYSKWYRPFLRRLAFSFGSPNYATESSCCFTSGFMAWKTATGMAAAPDMAHTDLLLGWALNPFYSSYLTAKKLMEQKAKGLKVIIVDPRITPATEKLADLHLQLLPGTDGALALAIANELISRGWIDQEYINKYVHGFEEYRVYASGFNRDNVEELTGVPYDKVVRAAEMIHASGSMCINESSAPLGHQRNGMQNYRAIMSLLAITGNYDRRPGGQFPAPHTYIHQASGFLTSEEEFYEEAEPRNTRPAVGSLRFPLWYYMEHEAQANDLSRQILEGTPYPVRAVLAFGMNYRMFIDSGKMLKAIEKLDFFVDTDLFMTDTAKYADIVLPACSSFERGEFKTYKNGYAWYTKPVIKPLGESRSDADIICQLANALRLDDEVLCGGQRRCMDHILRKNSFTVDDLLANEEPTLVPDFKPHIPGSAIEAGLPTPTGKFELKSELIAAHPEWHLDALPTYTPPQEPEELEGYPFRLVAGARLPNAIHSRLHDVPWPRSLRAVPQAEISLEDAAELGIVAGDRIRVITKKGYLSLEAAPTATVKQGQVFVYHGYREADPNSIFSADKLDPYSGFAGYRGFRCRIEKEV